MNIRGTVVVILTFYAPEHSAAKVDNLVEPLRPAFQLSGYSCELVAIVYTLIVEGDLVDLQSILLSQGNWRVNEGVRLLIAFLHGHSWLFLFWNILDDVPWMKATVSRSAGVWLSRSLSGLAMILLKCSQDKLLAFVWVFIFLSHLNVTVTIVTLMTITTL